MSCVTKFRALVMRYTAGDPARAVTLGSYIAMMEVSADKTASVRAQLTRAMNPGGPLVGLVERRLVRSDPTRKQPRCFRC